LNDLIFCRRRCRPQPSAAVRNTSRAPLLAAIYACLITAIIEPLLGFVAMHSWSFSVMTEINPSAVAEIPRQ
jgi:hypothetical protein